jgi:hypothetical protein
MCNSFLLLYSNIVVLFGLIQLHQLGKDTTYYFIGRIDLFGPTLQHFIITQTKQVAPSHQAYQLFLVHGLGNTHGGAIAIGKK